MFLVVWSALLKSSYPDVLRPWGESQVCKNHKENFAKVNPVVSKSLGKALAPQCQALQATVVIFASPFLNAWVSCITIAAALGLLKRIWV